MPTDQKLITRIAEKFGWEKHHPIGGLLWIWRTLDRKKSYNPFELPSTDACLALLDEKERVIFERAWIEDGGYLLHMVTYKGIDRADKSLPRTILLAILEVE